MKTRKMKWLGAALLAVAGLAGKASAILPSETSAYLNIQVTINASLNVSVLDNAGVAGSTYTSTAWTGAANQALSGSSATVTNTSTALSEKWALSTDTGSLDVSGLTTNETWSNAASTTNVSHDQYGVQAVFGSSWTVNCPAAGAPDWNSSANAPALTTSPVLYTSAMFADAGLAAGGGKAGPDNATYGQMYVGGTRALCWQVIMPKSTYTTHTQEIQVVVTAIPAS